MADEFDLMHAVPEQIDRLAKVKAGSLPAAVSDENDSSLTVGENTALSIIRALQAKGYGFTKDGQQIV